MQKFIYLLACFLLFENLSFAQKKSSKKEAQTAVADTVAAKPPAKPTPKDNFKSIKEVTERCKVISGLFPLYQDTVTGKIYLEINENQIDKSFIYFRYGLDAAVDAGTFRGAYQDNKLIHLQKYFDRIEITIKNTGFYFNPENALSKAADANINLPIVVAEKLLAVQIDTLDTLGNQLKRYLIDGDAVFLQEALGQIKRSRMPNEGPDAFSMGSLSSKKSKITAIYNYPENTDVEVEYVYENPYPVNYGSAEVTDARVVSVKQRHSLIQLPDNQYKPRLDDPRVGYFLDISTDLTSTSVTPYRDFINRWHLEKKDSLAAISEPKVPITFWMEKTTPENLRPIIKAATEKWNIAFEKAGFKNAVICLQQPDSATWDAGDIRYNVIRWTSSPNPPFGGYGPSFTNPLTGQILGADIMLEWIYLTNRLRVEEIFDVAGMQMNCSASSDDHHFCAAGETMHQNLLYGMQVLKAMNADSLTMTEFLTQALYDLVLHEVGHTLGLNHNFIASMLRPMTQLNDKKLGEEVGLTASVMDYTLPNIAPDKKNQGLYFDNRPGAYDLWAIAYGYTVFPPEKEKQGLDSILALSVKPEHRFFNDADDMRNPGKGVDPRVMLFDMSADPMQYAEDQIVLIQKTMGSLKEKYNQPGTSYHELRNAYLILSGNYSRHTQVFSRWIGGVLIDRNFQGQSTAKPYTPVALQEQKRAMALLSKYAFAPDAYSVEGDLYNYLQIQRRGYSSPMDGETPKIHDRVLNAQKSVLDHVLSANTCNRMVDAALFGNQYAVNTMLSDLTDAVFKADINTTVNSFRQNLQVEYLKRLLTMLDDKKYQSAVKSSVYQEIMKIKRIASTLSADASTKAHRSYLLFIINDALEK